jgi:excinuclease UvrABC nuclease subunit
MFQFLERDEQPFTDFAIQATAPEKSGVYAIFEGHNQCLYVGEGEDVRKKLLAHFRGDVPCINRLAPKSFRFESIPEPERAIRLAELQKELRPLCA